MSVQENINRLLWDRRLVLLPDELDAPEDLEYVILKDLSLEDRNYYLFIRDLEEARARKEGVSTEGELMEQARAADHWTKDDDDVQERADEHIAFLEAEFLTRAKFKSRQNIIKLQIEDAIAKKEYVIRKRNDLRQRSAKYLAHEIASFMMLRRVAFRPDGNPLLPDDRTYLHLKKEHIVFLFFLIQEMMSEGALETVDIREVARSAEWRLTWCLSKETLPALFNRTIGDLTINHKMLIYWSRVYDSAFEATEPPEDNVISDDDKFDEWLSNRDLERRQDNSDSKTAQCQEHGKVLDGEYIETCICGAKAYNHGKGLGERRMHDTNCQYATFHRYTPQEKEAAANRVYGRNSKGVRKLINNEQERVLQKGEIEEQNLRGTKTRVMLGMPTKIIKIK